MKICATKIMKIIKNLEKRKEEVILFERRNDVETFLSDEKRIPTKYNYNKVKSEISSLDTKTRKLKTILAKANIETMLEDFDMSVSEGLIYLSQLSESLNRLKTQVTRDELTRVTPYGSKRDIVEYHSLNYDLAKAKKDYDKLVQEINNLQMSIDRCNLNNYIEVEDYLIS